ncbi:MAG: ThiF family adenylyltransferase, partial [Pseudomonadota bacterium]
DRTPPPGSIGLRKGTIREDKLPRILASRRSTIGLNRYGGYWGDLPTIAQRNLTGLKTLADISIALVGCGTIGGHLAKFLVQSGAGGNASLTLVDRQSLASGNIGRHYLGTSRIGEAKASALRDELKRFHPQADVRFRIDDANDVWDDVKAADLIIDATGEWNTQYGLNERFMAEDANASAILHTWVSGNGAAARSFLNMPDDEFCFRCMRPKMKGQHRYPALKPNVEANVAEATCGEGAFYPYSVAAPAIAAALACDVAIAWANGKPGPRLRTQVLDYDRAIHRKPTTPSPHNECPSCNARKSDD